MSPDLHLVQQIEGALTRDPRIDLPQCAIAIDSDSGYVTLSGTVNSVAAKRLALRLTAQIPGVRGVDDRLRVAVASPMGDLQIADHVRHAFIQERNLEEDHITIEVDADGGVTLRGTLHSLAQRRLAEVLCWWVPGVTDVSNLLVLNPREEDNDEELKDNLVTVMEKDALVNPRKFRIEVRQGVVTLRGQVDSPVERSAAEKDCWYTPGVVDVINELRVA
jgi:osmotically-inducible protein OsmY